jgi:hypothetical protein
MLTMDKYLDYHWSHEKIETSFGDYEILRAVLGVMNFLDQFWGSLMVIYANHG